MKIIGFTSIRSDYDIMSPLYKALNQEDQIDFRIIVSGTHLLEQFGKTINIVQKDDLKILAEIPTIENISYKGSRVRSAGKLLEKITDIIQNFKPDLLIYAGDREDVIVYAMLGAYLDIPTIHFYSGDHGLDGYVDNPIRHAASKLSTFCFVALEEHKKRLIAMGENPKRIKVIGNISLDNFVNFQPLSKQEICDKLGISHKNKFSLLIFHPITAELEYVDQIFRNILNELKKRNIFTFVSFPNTDFGSHRLLQEIQKYDNDPNFFFYRNLDRGLFLSIYKHSMFIIGNSSSGICESASIPIPAINVGMRQYGRYSNSNVIFCGTSSVDISQAISKATSDAFVNSIKNIQNCYGNGESTQYAINMIKSLELKQMLTKSEDPIALQKRTKKRVVVISTHPDDETLGAGGTLLRHIANDDEVHCVFCTDILEEEGFSKEVISTREKEIEEVIASYGFSSTHRLGLKTMRVDGYSKSELVSRFSKIFQSIQPNIIYLPFCDDVHSDHRCIFDAVFSCTKSFRYPSIERVLMMETLSETEFAPSLPHRSFIPNVFVDITDFIDKKCEIMQIYKSEIAPPPFPRSLENIKALALYRGSTMGATLGGGGIDDISPRYAESFMLLKEKW